VPENSLSKVLAAAVTAAGWHATQRRKGSAGEPYINHLLEVAALVSRVTQGEDADLVLAALLHDAVEDQGISRQTIAAMFGEDVAGLVMEVTDDKWQSQEVHKRLQVNQAPKKSRRAKILKLADKISNVTAIGRDPPPDWPFDRQLDYVQWGCDVVAGLRGASPELEQRFDEAADEATRLIAARRR
jgi:(p)ppGpp synthase/HD superfamily hydrolase